VLHGAAARGTKAPDYPFGWSSQQWDEYLGDVDRRWGTQEMADHVAAWGIPTLAPDAALRREYASFLRFAASPGAALVFESFSRHRHPGRPPLDPSPCARNTSDRR
jgi:hypothetical protein